MPSHLEKILASVRERNELDNGMVSEDHVSLADQAIYAAREAGEGKA